MKMMRKIVQIDERLCNGAGAEVRPLLENGQVANDLFGAGDPAYASAGREYLREGTGIDNALLVVE